jgi:hypothetical protein
MLRGRGVTDCRAAPAPAPAPRAHAALPRRAAPDAPACLLWRGGSGLRTCIFSPAVGHVALVTELFRALGKTKPALKVRAPISTG